MAAGRGVRFGSPDNKVFASLLGRPLLGWTLQAFADCEHIDKIILVGSESDLPRLREIGTQYGGGKVIDAVLGGATRQESVYRGLAAVPESAECVVVHDGARCCVTPDIITRSVEAAREFDAATASIPIADTLVRGQGDILNGETVDRDNLYAIQTPQSFRPALLREAHESALRDSFSGTDDAGLVRRIGGPQHTFRGSAANLKVTQAEDLILAESIFRGRGAAPMIPTIRVGHGYDVHQFAAGREMWLGGVLFPESPKGLLGHSDADALLHAVCDALLGAAGMGDIGKLFPPSDDRHKDRRSIEFLAEVKSRLDAAGWRIGNIDISVLAEFPKIGPRAGDIRETIAVCLNISADAVSVKATTNEEMGFVGRGEGIAVHATTLLFR